MSPQTHSLYCCTFYVVIGKCCNWLSFSSLLSYSYSHFYFKCSSVCTVNLTYACRCCRSLTWGLQFYYICSFSLMKSKYSFGSSEVRLYCLVFLQQQGGHRSHLKKSFSHGLSPVPWFYFEVLCRLPVLALLWLSHLTCVWLLHLRLISSCI